MTRPTRRHILLTILLALALVVTASAVIEAYGEATSPKAPTAALSGTPLTTPAAASGRPWRLMPVVWLKGGVPTEARTAVLGAMVAAQRLQGVASWMPAKHGPSYLAMRLPRGTQVRICAATCWDGIVSDYGPSKRIHPDRIADIAVERWEAITGLDRSVGVARVTVTVGLAVAARPTPPATSTEGETP